MEVKDERAVSISSSMTCESAGGEERENKRQRSSEHSVAAVQSSSAAPKDVGRLPWEQKLNPALETEYRRVVEILREYRVNFNMRQVRKKNLCVPACTIIVLYAVLLSL